MNTVYGNGYGIKLLNNCNIASLSGNCGATLESGTQFIHDNTNNDVYMTGSSVPQRFRYNAIHHNGNMPFVYHDAYVAFGGEGEWPVRGSIDVKYNYWGSGFVPTTHLYTNLIGGDYDYNPEWVLGDCHDEWVDAAMLLNEADSLNEAGTYDDAQLAYKRVVENHPETVSAETALKSLLQLEAHLESDYLSLKEYYLSNSTIVADEILSHLASTLANKCDERMENYADAIAWYEAVIVDSATNFNDSIFAAIDLGDLYLKMGVGGEKGVCGKLKQFIPESPFEHVQQTERALSLVPQHKAGNVDKDPYPIEQLVATVYDNDTVSLTWSLPQCYNTESIILTWMTNEEIEDYTSYGYDSFMGHLYDANDLRGVVGRRIESVTFQKVSDWCYYVYIWKQSNGSEMETICSQMVPENVPMGENTIYVDEELYIEPNTNYWISIRAKIPDGHQSKDLYPFCQGGLPIVHGKGDLMMGANPPYVWISNNYLNFWLKFTLGNLDKNTNEMACNRTLSNQYHIYRNGDLIAEIPYTFQTYYIDTEFTRDFDVEYCVTAVYGEEESEPVCATATITGVAEEQENDGVTVLPNPTNGHVHIEGAGVAEVIVYNAIGQLVKTVQDTNEIDLKGLPIGMYLLRIIGENGAIATRKLVLE